MRNFIIFGCLAFSLAACSSTSIPGPFTPVGPTIPSHFYVANDATPGGVLQYNLPLTAASLPNFTIAANNTVAIALDSAGHLAAGDYSAHLAYVGTVPLSATSTATAQFNNGAGSDTGQIAFTSNGTMYAGDTGAHVYGFAAPFSNASVPSTTTATAGLTSAVGLGFDASGNMYVGNAGGAGSNLYVFAPPYTGSPTVSTPVVTGQAFRKLGLSSTQLFVANVGGTGGIYVYNLPLTSASTPAFVIADAQDPEGVSVDPSGNVYVGNLSNSTIWVFSPPFSAASVPATTLTVGGGAYAIFGIAIGP